LPAQMPDPTLDSVLALSRLYANLLAVESRLLERLLALRAQLPVDDGLHPSLDDAIRSLEVTIRENATALLDTPAGAPASGAGRTNGELQRRTDQASALAELRWREQRGT